ncbi:MAG TPA: glucan 1,4-alpha-glucosidase [Chloroflexi bacterium]|nr:glucan 1,4-alpha-glucosidase [Chloroflexota bacterium]
MNEDELCTRPAPGGPGSAPRWTRGDKDAVGTAYSTSSRVWYTLSRGILNEVYYPTIDRPQIRDLQYLITDGKTFFHDEQRHLESWVEALSPHGLGVRVTSTSPAYGYRIVKEIIADPHESCVLIHTRVEAEPDTRRQLRLFVLCAPHLEVGGWDNSGRLVTIAERKVLCAHKGNVWLALGASVPFLRCSYGYAGINDGWQDLAADYEMDWEFDCAFDGNIALLGELDLGQGTEFTLGLAFGNTFHNAATCLFQSLGIPFAAHRRRFAEQWRRACKHLRALEQAACDGGALYHRSESLLLAHEDKLYPGAMIASLSIPWGEAKGDEDGLGGYHLVWTRDMVNSAMGLLATNNTATPLRALIYLAISQRPDGGFYQNFWVNGEPYWRGIQLDEVAFPILLAWRLHTMQALQDFDPYPMVRRAASYLIRQGPATPQERWEENSGYSPATLASNIAALTSAAEWMRQRGEDHMAAFVQEYADFLECHVEAWTVTTQGALVPGIPRHYIRITPTDVNDPRPQEDPNRGLLQIANRRPGERAEVPAKDVVDAGFLELVRYGIRPPGDRLVEDSLRVVDTVLKVETPFGPCWRRYNHDGYGQRPDGGPFEGWGKGRAWPLLTGERGHYELAAGRPSDPFIRAMEGFAHAVGLFPEQVWDEADQPEWGLFCGRPTGSAMPLMWAHAEYIKLLRSTVDGQVVDFLPAVAERYRNRTAPSSLEIWKPNRQARFVQAGSVLRIQAPASFHLIWTKNEWQDVQETRSSATGLGIEFVDIPVAPEQRAPIRFTFRWTPGDRWEGQDYAVGVDAREDAG